MQRSFGQLTASLPDGGSQEYSLSKASISLGRNSTSDIVLRDTKASRNHARLECSDRGCVVVDLGSANGTSVNGNRVRQATLVPGDVVKLGDSTFRFELSGPEPDPEMTRVIPEGDLDGTLAEMPLTMDVRETGAARLAVHTPARTWEIPLTGDSISIGRNPGSDVFIDSSKVSRRHARVERNRDAFVLVDLQSDNGTWLGEQKITRHTLEDGDSIRIGSAQLVFKAGFQSDDLTVVESTEAGQEVKCRPVVIVPGFAGTNLYRGNQQIWPQPRLLINDPEVLRIDVPLEPRGLLHEVVIIPNLIKLDQYSLLVDYLVENLGYETDKNLLEFGYDFRKDIRDSARRLAEAIEKWGVKTPITIIAHSMGCLVTRYYVERLGGRKRVERIILLGGPHSGTPYALASLIKGPNLLPFGLRNDRLSKVLSGYPSWFQILPIYPFAFDRNGAAIDVLGDCTWLMEEHRRMVQHSIEFRSELGTQSSVPTVCIFGYGLKTITRANLERESSGLCRKVDLEVTPAGDGTIPESSAVMDGVEIHPVRQYHGTLYVDNDVKMRLKLELTRSARFASA